MKSKLIGSLFLFIATSSLISCSTGGKSVNPSDLSSAGPTVLNVRVNPSVIELNQNLQAKQPAQITADIKDFHSKIAYAQLKFNDVPISIPMNKAVGTTWQAQLSPQQLQMLAVSGKTITYKATVIAENENGQAVQSATPVDVTIKAPEIS